MSFPLNYQPVEDCGLTAEISFRYFCSEDVFYIVNCFLVEFVSFPCVFIIVLFKYIIKIGTEIWCLVSLIVIKPENGAFMWTERRMNRTHLKQNNRAL